MFPVELRLELLTVAKTGIVSPTFLSSSLRSRKKVAERLESNLATNRTIEH